MSPLPIVKHLDVFKETLAGLLAGSIIFVINKLGFQRPKETLGHRVVQTFTLSTHRAQQAVILEQLTIMSGRISTALVGMDDDVLHFSAVPKRHRQCVVHELGVVLRTHRPADDLP